MDKAAIDIAKALAWLGFELLGCSPGVEGRNMAKRQFRRES
jgi:hypothetical protein